MQVREWASHSEGDLVILSLIICLSHFGLKHSHSTLPWEFLRIVIHRSTYLSLRLSCGPLGIGNCAEG